MRLSSNLTYTQINHNMKIKSLFFITLLSLGSLGGFAADRQLQLKSPDEKLLVNVAVNKEIVYSVLFNSKAVLLPSTISLTLDKLILGNESIVKSTKTNHNHEFNELIINFENSFSLVFRAYNEGIAYRFLTDFKGGVKVISEQADFNLPGQPAAILQQTDSYTSWEGSYIKSSSVNAIANGVRATTPALFDYQDASVKVLIAESDVWDYPGMYIQKKEGKFVGEWAKYPAKTEMGSWGNFVSVVKQRENFLARTNGKRAYPWRVLIIADEDKALLNNHLIAKLAQPVLIKDIKWIKPGKAAWEWWHDAMLPGLDIPSGMDNRNTLLYNYYVHFAATHHLEYLMIDAGWSDNYDVTKINPKLDIKEVIKGAKEKNVGIFLWCVASTIMKDLDKSLDFIQSLGAVGIKVDFFDRDDQLAMQWMEQIAKAAAKRKLMVNFHGCTKPSGMEVTYPNIVNYEAVRGAESDKWDYSINPDHHLIIPFIRMLAGPMDYTPGAMRNKTKADFKPIDPGLPSGQGTRCHELAMFVIYNQTFAMLADSPVEYMKYPDIMNYLSRVPTVFDETKPLAGKIGEYAIIAKRKGQEWFVGAMTNWTERSIPMDFRFLPAGKSYTAEIYTDNEDANLNAERYDYKSVKVNSNTKLDLKMASGGGAAIYIHP
ncbi:glycoside hydrolase family 97 protein [Pedobacter hiemivivus]|uniref:Glycoside hydrolase family 97 protein n=2 Tax=Pedobacter hiemivivus TaxID=2530454 RepID=A0A4U1G3T4_9SPHI|nr:glycoside hydrolase family 97 protein [Pedobacter hiemivivus]